MDIGGSKTRVRVLDIAGNIFSETVTTGMAIANDSDAPLPALEDILGKLDNKDAIVCSQFAGASTLEETMSAVQGSGLGPDAAQEIFDTTIARYVDHIDPMIGSAVIFALIGFFLVTGIEIAGKVIAKRKAA
jgi:hypothetical protein